MAVCQMREKFLFVQAKIAMRHLYAWDIKTQSALIAQTLLDKGIEVVYIALHGKYGEDGCIQGLLEILGLPYTGCGHMASAISMDKHMTKQALFNSGIPLIKSISIISADEVKNGVDLKFPVMVKPSTEG